MSFFIDRRNTNQTPETQEQWAKTRYKSFRRQWARAVNDPRAKSKIVACDEYIVNSKGVGMWSKGSGRCRKTGWIHPAHHVLFNLILERDLDTGFTPVTAKRKMPSVYTVWQRFNEAVSHLITMCERAKQYTEGPVANKWDYNRLTDVMKFLEPFGDTVTLGHLAKIDINKLRLVRRFIEKDF